MAIRARRRDHLADSPSIVPFPRRRFCVSNSHSPPIARTVKAGQQQCLYGTASNVCDTRYFTVDLLGFVLARGRTVQRRSSDIHESTIEYSNHLSQYHNVRLLHPPASCDPSYPSHTAISFSSLRKQSPETKDSPQHRSLLSRPDSPKSSPWPHLLRWPQELRLGIQSPRPRIAFLSWCRKGTG